MTNILHIASFYGNIGDNASHIGFEKILKENLTYFKKTNLEIRKFYKNYQEADRMEFNSAFIDYINTFDLFVIGGGGFLDYWLPESATGTTIDISRENLSRIKIPTLITSVGCHPHKEIPDGNIEKFRSFLDASFENANIHIALRNDGSILNLKNNIGFKYFETIPEILDHGFFYTSSESKQILKCEEPYIAINVTADQLSMKSSRRTAFDIHEYLIEMRQILDYVINILKMKVIFVPHIFSDIEAICDIIKPLSGYKYRSNIFIAPLLQGNDGTNILFSIYRDSAAVIGSRFHSNVCSLAMEKPVLGLGILDRVHYLFTDLNIEHRCIDINSNFSDKTLIALNECLANKQSPYLEDLKKKKLQTVSFYKKIFSILNMK
ncbi:MAG: polysaccharide pyruvyl transferase family protein [Bdellovibrionaceae bacterium]|nr:polysaccharide pyruvyl transferase family protein [Pseudobdellovibrionaceae bacterium]